MNERISELAREAGFYANSDVEKFEKFAELIVKECIAKQLALAVQYETTFPKAYLFTNVLNCDVTCSTDPSYKTGASWKIEPLYTHTCCQLAISNTEKKEN